MKIADRPPHFIDPPDLSPESEEEIRTYGYPRQDVPSRGEEPLRAGDVISYISHPMNTRSYAQVIETHPFENCKENDAPVIKLHNSYPVHYHDTIRRVYVMNYTTGELEDNRIWAHHHPLYEFKLVKCVVCGKTRKTIRWNRRGRKAELQSQEIVDAISKLHDNAQDDLTRSFLNVPKPQPQRVDYNAINDDTLVYDETEDVCYKIFSFSDKDDSSKSSDDDSIKTPAKCRGSDICSISSSESSGDESSSLDSSPMDAVASSEDESHKSDSSLMIDELSSGNEADDDEDGILLLHDAARRTGASPVSNILSSDDGTDDDEVGSLSLNTLTNAHRNETADRKNARKDWSSPVAILSCWKTALKSSEEMEGCDWQVDYQNGKRKKLTCVSHVDCRREMKIVRNEDDDDCKIYLCGSHTTTISMLPFPGKGM